jgi:hypothetical protein
MKTMKTILAGIMISASCLLTAGPVSLYPPHAQNHNNHSSNCNNNNNNQNNQNNSEDEEVTQQDVINYLHGNGYYLLTDPRTEDGGRTWTSNTQKEGNNYITTVYTDGVNIVGHTDVDDF